MAARKLYFETIHLGEDLSALAKAPIDRVQLARYAGASGDYNPIHVDEIYAKAAGMPSVLVPGMLVMGFLAQLASEWGKGGQLRKYSVRFIKIVWPGDTIVCRGRVTDRWGETGRYFIELELWAENQKGELVMRGQSVFQLFYSQEDESRQRAGQPPILIDVPRQSLLSQPAPATPEPSVKPPAVESKKTTVTGSKKTSASKTSPRHVVANKVARKKKKTKKTAVASRGQRRRR